MAQSEKARLYRQIIENTSENEIVERMRLHGFWAPDVPLPSDPLEELNQRATLERELDELRRRYTVDVDPQEALAQERRRRWEESKARRAARKAERAAQQAKRRAEYEQFRQGSMVHAGHGVSAGLAHVQSDVDLLKHLNLPIIHNSAELAAAMGVSLSKLRWLTYHRKAATIVHYRRYEIAKKTGGVRCISAPKPALAALQRWVLEQILMRLQIEPVAHGFVPGRSILSNAIPHVSQPIVLNLDLKDFFPTISFRRVKGLMHQIGYSEHVATTLALLMTEPPRVTTELDGKVYHVALSQRVLPQGACTSPAITNLICRKLDRRLAGLADKHGFAYTRYADDLTFSGRNPKSINKLLKSLRAIVQSEGFTEHPKKTKVMRQGRRQEVTGVVVNQQPSVGRDEIRRLRAILHNCGKHGLSSQNRDGHPNFVSYLRGKIAYVSMISPQRGKQLRAMLDRVLANPPSS